MIVDVDVVVAGAGPAGLLLAGDLAQAGSLARTCCPPLASSS